jgi:phosphoglycerate dehydrogenase-like enzyme
VSYPSSLRLASRLNADEVLASGILGYGAIGRQVARLFSALGFEVYAYTRSPRPTPESRKDDSYLVPGIAGDPNGELPTAWFSGASHEEVNAFLAQDLDVLAICLPLTDATNHLIGAEQLDILSRKQAFISNIARGAIVDQDALVKALEAGKLSGAALDVFDPEPLPKGHPLWTAPNCYITPHVSWATAHYWDRLLLILETNLDRLAKGEDLINVMDRVAHY